MRKLAATLLLCLLAATARAQPAATQAAPFPSGPAAAAPAGCPGFFVGGRPPALLNPKLAVRTRLLCFSAFAVLHSGVTRTPLWSAEHLTADALAEARSTPRVNAFHEEPGLPPEDRAELADYARSGFDRGHMAPAGDMPDPEAQQESFSLANMVPQDHRLNTGLWEGIESAVRSLAEREGELYVVTGPLFQGASLQTVPSGRVLVPTAVFKAIYDPRAGAAGVYLAPNTDQGGWQAISVAALRQMAGMDVFPALPEVVKARVMTLPEPTPHYMGRDTAGERHGRHRRRRGDEWWQ